VLERGVFSQHFWRESIQPLQETVVEVVLRIGRGLRVPPAGPCLGLAARITDMRRGARQGDRRRPATS